MKLYDFQLIACKEILSNSTSSDLLQSPTGSGKTVMGGYLCNEYLGQGLNVLFIAHRKELIEQTQDKFIEQFGIESSLIRADEKSNLSFNMQIASIQTFNKRLNFTPDVIFIDEAHRSEAATYQKVIKAFPNAKLIGLTATPYRLSGKGLNKTYQRLIQTKSVKELEGEGFLVPAVCRTYPIDHNKLSNIKVIGSDYNEHELAELMEDRAMIEDIVVSYIATSNGLKSICFATSVKHSQMICRRFNEMGIKALHVDAKDKERSSKIEEFRNGDTLVLCNIGIATEGFDLKECRCVILARPTFSLSLYLQMCGRGSRTLEGKESYVLLDHSNNLMEHGAPNKEHDWKMYFEGVTKKQIEQLKEGKRFKAIDSEGNEYTIEDIFNIPFDVKGFVLEEIETVNTVYITNKIKTISIYNIGDKKKCQYCENEFIINSINDKIKKYCSKSCSRKYRRNIPLEVHTKEKVCKTCSANFISKHYHSEFCSKKCARHFKVGYKIGESKICKVCNNTFNTKTTNQSICSEACHKIYRTEKANLEYLKKVGERKYKSKHNIATSS